MSAIPSSYFNSAKIHFFTTINDGNFRMMITAHMAYMCCTIHAAMRTWKCKHCKINVPHSIDASVWNVLIQDSWDNSSNFLKISLLPAKRQSESESIDRARVTETYYIARIRKIWSTSWFIEAKSIALSTLIWW